MKNEYSVINKHDLKQYISKKGYLGGVALARDWGTIFVIILLNIYIDSIAIYVFSVLVIGVFQYAIGETLMHEASHYNLFKKRKWNDQFQMLYAWPFLATIDEYRRQHLGHHKFLGELYKDHVEDDYVLFGLRKIKVSAFWIWFGRPLFCIPAYLYLKMLFSSSDRGETQFDAMQVSLLIFWVLVFAVFTVFGALEYLLLYWIVPLVWGYSVVLYWNEITEHYCATTGTRSTFGPLYNWLFHNQGYHALHHKYPSIPFYSLPDAYAALKTRDVDITGDASEGFWNTYCQINSVLKERKSY